MSRQARVGVRRILNKILRAEMSKPSNWAVTPDAVRCILPSAAVSELAKHPLSRDLFPHAVGFYPNAKGHCMTRTTHDDWLFLYCVQGKATVEVKGIKYPVSKGDLVFLPYGLPHSYRADEQHAWSVYWVHFMGEKANHYVAPFSFGNNRPVLSIGLHQRLVTDFCQLVEVASNNSSNDIKRLTYAANLLKQMICYIALLKPAEGRKGNGSLNIEHVHLLMEMKINGVLNLKTLAAHFGLSKFYFAKRYRQSTGQSPIATFIRMKMTHACRQLDTTDVNIGEIACAIGYQDVYYFSRLFKKVIGFSPKQYRNLNKG